MTPGFVLLRTATRRDWLHVWRRRQSAHLFGGATSGTFWRFKPLYLGLIGPGGVRPTGTV